MEGNKDKPIKIVAVLVAVLVIAAIVVAVLMTGGMPGGENDENETVGNQIDSLVMLGEGGWEGFNAVAVGDDGTVYAVGNAYDQTNITTEGAFDGTYGGNSELFLAKYSPGLDSLLVCTYLGGSSDEMAYDIAVDADGYVYVAGGTTSQDFPVTEGSADPIGPTGFGGGAYTNFVCRLAPDLSAIDACTFIGGEIDYPNCCLGFAPEGNVIIAGCVEVGGMNATEGAFTESRPGMKDIYVAIISPELDTIEAFTYLGGSEDDYVYDLAIDGQGSVYLACGSSLDVADPAIPFPISEGAYQPEAASPGFYGNIEGIIVKLSGDLSSLEASTYFGSDDIDMIFQVEVHPDGSVLVCGQTRGGVPTTEGAYLRDKVTTLQAFVAKFDPNLAELRACTYFGTGTTYALSLACDEEGRIYLHGNTGQIQTTEGAIRESYGGWNSDLFLSQLSSDLSFLRSSTYLGGNYDEFEGYGLAVTANGTVYVAGGTTSTNFPSEGVGNADPDFADGFILKISIG